MCSLVGHRAVYGQDFGGKPERGSTYITLKDNDLPGMVGRSVTLITAPGGQFWTLETETEMELIPVWYILFLLKRKFWTRSFPGNES